MKTDAPSALAGPHATALRLALFGLLGAVLVWVAGRKVSSVVEPRGVSVSRGFLTLRDGKLFRQSAAVPFTGFMQEHYESGTRKSRSEVKNGLLDGVSEGWHTNGVRQVLEHFDRGLSHGARIKWHENGRRLSEVTIVRGVLHGTFRRWDEGGVLLETVELRSGKPDGKSVGYYPSGFVRVEAMMKEGQIVEKKEFPDGERKPSTHPGTR